MGEMVCRLLLALSLLCVPVHTSTPIKCIPDASDCGSMKASCHHEATQKRCPHACGLCPASTYMGMMDMSPAGPLCVDISPNCMRYPTSHCMDEIFKQRCRKSCGLCMPNSYWPSMDNADPGAMCMDTIPVCMRLTRRQCMDRYYKDNCPKSCGLCMSNSYFSSMDWTDPDCGSPPSVAHATASGSGRLIGDNTTYSCDGYRVLQNGPAQVECLSTGEWESPLFSCQLPDCGTPPTLFNGYVNSGGSTIAGGTKTYGCNYGYSLRNGPASLTCSEQGTWPSVGFHCQQITHKCYSCNSGSEMWPNEHCTKTGEMGEGAALMLCDRDDDLCYTQVGRYPAGTVFRGCANAMWYRYESMYADGCFEDVANKRYVCFCTGSGCNTNDMAEKSQEYLDQALAEEP